MMGARFTVRSYRAQVALALGGTNVRAGAVTWDGQLLNWQDTPLEAARGPEAGLQITHALELDNKKYPSALANGHFYLISCTKAAR